MGDKRRQHSTECPRWGKHIAPLLFTHNVLFARGLDSVSTNRLQGVKTPLEDNHVHTRAVFRATAGVKLLDHFNSELKLLVAVCGVIQVLWSITNGYGSWHTWQMHQNISEGLGFNLCVAPSCYSVLVFPWMEHSGMSGTVRMIQMIYVKLISELRYM
jgi:hypothetical protein